MAWQFTTGQPIYLQIVDAIEMRIFNGTYPRGDRLPSVRDLAVTAAVNPNTMQRALSELETRGLVSTQRTSGRTVTTEEAVVAHARREKAGQLCTTFLVQMKALGMDRAETLRLLGEKAAALPEMEEEAKEEEHGDNT